MILDNLINFSGGISAAGAMTGQLITANSTLSTNTVDANASLGASNIGESPRGVDILIHILVAPATCTDVQFQIIQADDAALTSNVQVVRQSGAIPIASLPAGTRLALRYGRAGPLAPKRYVGLRYICTGSTVTALSVFAAAASGYHDVARVFNAGTTGAIL